MEGLFREKMRGDELTDKVFRSLGLLKSAYLLTSEEMTELLSNIRLGVSMGIITDIDISKINRIADEGTAAAILYNHGENTSAAERDKIRAETVKKILNESEEDK